MRASPVFLVNARWHLTKNAFPQNQVTGVFSSLLVELERLFIRTFVCVQVLVMNKTTTV